MTQKNELIDKIENGITELIHLFRNNATQFKYEIYLTHQFHDVLVKKLCDNSDLKIRWELKSKMAYDGKKPTSDSKYFARYDISLIKEKSEEVLFAFEFKLFKDLQFDIIDENTFYQSKFKGSIDDINKLTNPDNKVEKGYILTFAYGNISSKYQNRIDTHKEKINDYKGTFQDLVNIASVAKNDIKIACAYYGEIGDAPSTFNIHLYPDSFCAALNQNEGIS